MKKIVIIGMGISGLSAAWFLKQKYKNKLHITLIDKANHPGGFIKTIYQKDFLFELGPRGFRPSGKGKVTLDLVKELGLQKELIFANSKSKKRYLYSNEKLQTISPLFLIKQGFIQACIRDLRTAPIMLEDETVASFVTRRLGPKILCNIADPLIKGIFGGDPYTLSMKSCFPDVWNLEKTNGSLLKGFLKKPRQKKIKTASLASFKKGMQTLPQAIANKLEAEFLFSEEVLKVEKKGKNYLLHLKQKQIETDCVICAVSDSVVARLFHIPQIIEKSVSLATVNMGWRGKQFPIKGYGFLVPSKENRKIFGATFDSDIFPEQNFKEMTRITVILPFEDEQEKIKEIAFQEISHIFSIKVPEVCTTTIHTNAICQYTLGHEKRLSEAEKKLPENVFLLGKSYKGIGVNDCIVSSKHLANLL